MGKRILIVDDEPEIVRVLQFRLEMNGFEIEGSHSGPDALEKISRFKFDLILLDYFLPSIKGDEVCEEVRRNADYSKTPVIIMTAFSNYEPDYFKERGATEVIYKPLAMDDLMDKINASLVDG